MSSRKTIAVLTPWLSGHFLSGILVAIHEIARAHDLDMIVICTAIHTPGQRDLTQENLIDAPLAAQHIAGWIVIGEALKPDKLSQLASSGVPIVTISRNIGDQDYPLVLGDNPGGMRQVVEHMVAHGHRRIAFVGSLYMSDMRERYESYLAVLKAHSIAFDPALVFDMPQPWPDYGREVVGRLVAAGMPCTAVVCANDDLAVGLLDKLQSNGYKVPEDVAVTGFDDQPGMQYLDPPLTSVAQKSEALGVQAIHLLLRMLAGEQIAHGPHLVPTTLVERRSCGCDHTSAARLAGRHTHQEPLSWDEELTERLLQQLQTTKPRDVEATRARLLPAVATIVRAVRSAVDNLTPPGTGDLEEAWETVLEQTKETKLHYALISLLGHSAEQELIGNEAIAHEARDRLEQMLDHLRAVLAQTAQAVENRLTAYYGVQMRNHDLISGALLRTGWLEKHDMSWMRWTELRWGCLATWSHSSIKAMPPLSVIAAWSADGSATPPLGSYASWDQFLPTRVLSESNTDTLSDMPLLIPFITSDSGFDSGGGVLTLIETVDQMFHERYNSLFRWMYILTVALERENLLKAMQSAKEMAETANHLKTQFIANMSHELRTPLSAILNFTDFLGDPQISGGSLTEQQQMFRQRVLSNGEHLLGLINDILDLAKIEAGKMEIAPDDLDLVPLLHGVMSTAIGLTADKGLRLELEVDDELPHVWGDRVRIRQIMLNLLSNAAKFTLAGGITVRAVETAYPGPVAQQAGELAQLVGAPERPELRDEAEASKYILVTVQDTGIGIRADKQHLVFEEFRQVESELAEARGTGLGMPISKKFVELHGGQMWLESTPGAGSTFSFTLPIADRDEAAPAGEAQDRDEVPSS